MYIARTLSTSRKFETALFNVRGECQLSFNVHLEHGVALQYVYQLPAHLRTVHHPQQLSHLFAYNITSNAGVACTFHGTPSYLERLLTFGQLRTTSAGTYDAVVNFIFFDKMTADK